MSFKRLSAYSCALLAILYVVLGPWNSVLYNFILFPFPDPRQPDIASEFLKLKQQGITCEKVNFRSKNGSIISALFFRNPNSSKVILYSHTKGNNMYGKLHVVENLLLCGASAFVFDYQGYGRSEGRASVTNACDDAVSAYDFLRKTKLYKENEVIAHGESFGSGVTCDLQRTRHLNAIILHSAFASLRTTGREWFPWLWLYPDWTFPAKTLDNVAVLQSPHAPLLLIHGAADRVTSVHNSELIFKTACERKKLFVVPESGHCSFGKNGVVIQVIKDFLYEVGDNDESPVAARSAL